LVNQHRRDLTKSQRAAVAATRLPLISEEVNRKRVEKLRGTFARSGRESVCH